MNNRKTKLEKAPAKYDSDFMFSVENYKGAQIENERLAPLHATAVGFQAARELGITFGQLGYSEKYDSALAPFVTWAGLIGQYERAIQTYSNSLNRNNWISEQSKLERQFVARYRALYLNSQAPVQFLPQKWIVDFYSNLNHGE